MATKEDKARMEGARQERENILNLIACEIEDYKEAGKDEAKNVTDRMMNRVFAEIIGNLKTKIKFADFDDSNPWRQRKTAGCSE